MKIDLYDLRRREVQALGAALSCRNWQMMEAAYNSLRDKLDNAGFHIGATPTAEAASGAGEREAAPAQPRALARSIAELEAFERDGISLCEVENEVSFIESVSLCMHELKRLASRPPATAPAIPDGWKLVPVEQIEAADDAWQGLKQTQLAASQVGVEIAQSLREGYGLHLTIALRALAAAPTIPATGEAK